MRTFECSQLRINLDLPPAKRFADLPPDALEKSGKLLGAVLQHIPARARMWADVVRFRTSNRFQAEATALGRLVGHDWRSIMLANVSYDLAMTELGCSTMALATSNGPILARNMDWRVTAAVARCSYQIIWERAGKMRFITAGFPGAIGVITGLSAKGFCVALNAIKGFRGLGKTGYPVLLHLRRVLEDAETFDQAVDMLARTGLAAPCIFTVVGTDNAQRVVIERTKQECAFRWASEDLPLFTTNHFHVLPKPKTDNPGELFKTSFSRYDALCSFTADYSEASPTDDQTLLSILSDTAVLQEITAQHIIMRPRQQALRLFVPAKLLEDAPVEPTTHHAL